MALKAHLALFRGKQSNRLLKTDFSLLVVFFRYRSVFRFERFKP